MALSATGLTFGTPGKSGAIIEPEGDVGSRTGETSHVVPSVVHPQTRVACRHVRAVSDAVRHQELAIFLRHTYGSPIWSTQGAHIRAS